MNLERGVKRITLAVSVMAGLGAWVSSSIALCDRWYWDREQYLPYKEKYENIEWFWESWDADGWTRGGNKVAKNDVLHALLDSPWRGMPFTHGDIFDQISPEVGSSTDFTLSGCEVVPGMDAAMLDMPAAALAEVVQRARQDGLSKALANRLSMETFWTKRTRLQLMVFGIGFGFPVGAGAFIVVWLLFFLLRWIGRGFSSTTGEASADRRSGDSVSTCVNDLCGSADGEVQACNTQEGAPEGGRQSVTVGRD